MYGEEHFFAYRLATDAVMKREALNRFIRANEGLAWTMAEEFARRMIGSDLREIQNVIMRAMVDAAPKYDPSKARWSTYLKTWARFRIQELAFADTSYVSRNISDFKAKRTDENADVVKNEREWGARGMPIQDSTEYSEEAANKINAIDDIALHVQMDPEGVDRSRLRRYLRTVLGDEYPHLVAMFEGEDPPIPELQRLQIKELAFCHSMAFQG